jgi:hypothetical protein
MLQINVILGWEFETALQSLTPSTDSVHNVIHNYYLILEISSGSEANTVS